MRLGVVFNLLHFICLCPQVVKGELSVYLECTSTGNPYPSFTWWKNIEDVQDVTSDSEVTSQRDNRYTLSSGRFTIEDPENKDIGYYRCKAVNDYGVVLSRMAQIQFGCKLGLWMDELGFYVPSTVFQSFRDDERVNMKGCVQ